MAIKCGSCGKEFDSVKKLWLHMMYDHDSPALDGADRELCIGLLKKANDEKSIQILKKIEDN